jgi:hypothetical protein
MHGILKLRQMVLSDPALSWRARHGAVGTEEIVPARDGDTAPNVPQSTTSSGDTAGA